MIRNYIRQMSGKEPLSGVNVDEAVALGAAIRANITEKGEAVPAIGGRLFGKLGGGSTVAIRGAKAVSDVTAHSLGMISISPDGEAYINSIIIKKNTRIPAANTRPFSLRTRAKDNELEVYVLQGEHRRPLDNTIINKYVISGIERVSAPSSVIEVTYEYTANGVIQVSAVQKETGRSLPVKIEPVPEDMGWADGSPKDNPANSKGVPEVDVLLTVDLSGSMSGTPLEEAKKAMKKFVDEMDRQHTRIGLIPFADSVRCECSPTGDFRKVKKLIDKLTTGGVYGCGNGAHPFDLGLKELERGDSDVKYIVVLTDGMWYSPETAITAAKKCHRAGIEVMALGFGSADHAFLKKIASTDDFASITELSELGGSFSRIAQAIGEGSTGLSVL